MCNSQHFRSLLPAALKVVNEISNSSYTITTGACKHTHTHRATVVYSVEYKSANIPVDLQYRLLNSSPHISVVYENC